jgi:nucleoside-diphosphate-sugar epimerase
MTKGKVTVLGSNGHIGNAAMIAFRDAGWSVTGLGRTNRKPVNGTLFVAGDADDVEVVRAAIADADVVVHALHLRYDQWGNGRSEKQLQVVIDALGNSGKTLLFPGTIYNYRAGDAAARGFGGGEIPDDHSARWRLLWAGQSWGMVRGGHADGCGQGQDLSHGRAEHAT